jgi:PadR family transcriptional regulator PadR
MDTSQLLKGVLDLAVLELLRKRDGYGYEIVTHLREAGLEAVAEASVYGTLRRLHGEGLLDSYARPSDTGPHRKYYRLTELGEERRHELAKTWRRFVEVMDSVVEEAHR